MNIVFLLRLWPIYGGGETVTICLANEMAKRGHAVTVFYFKDSETNELPYIDPSIKAVRIPDVRCDEYTYSFCWRPSCAGRGPECACGCAGSRG